MRQDEKGTPETDREIAIGDIVELASDSAVVGAVVDIQGNSYKVLIDRRCETYYREQLRLHKEAEEEILPIAEALSAMVGYQIHNPGARNLYSLNSARIDFVPYQFRPALCMIQADSPRILVADDVGVGKTIEAGLILKEMEARAKLESVLIICPRPLVAENKWKNEMKRFDEDFEHLDGEGLRGCISDAERDGVWPQRYSKVIMPYSLFSEDSIRGRCSTSNRRHKRCGLEDLDPLPRFDLVIVDEAHNIRNANTWAYQGVELFCRNAEAVVFLTATPLQNSTDDLYTLLNLLRPDVIIDKDIFKTMAEPNVFVNNLLRIVRKQEQGWQEAGKKELCNMLSTAWGGRVLPQNPNFSDVASFLEKPQVTKEERIETIAKIERFHSFHGMINRTRRKDIGDFCIRRTQVEEVPYNSAQKELYEALMAFETAALAKMHDSRTVRFMMCTLMRQAASCIYGLVPFLQDILSRRRDQFMEDGEMYEEESTTLALHDDDQNSMTQLASEVVRTAAKLPPEDPKFDRLLEILKEKQTMKNNRVILFSSFRHTLSYLQRRLAEAGIRGGKVDGSVPDQERYVLRQRFLLDRSEKDALDILLFSEVGCEGLDYQFCDTMVNYDLPWNPMRIEQRIGRIDRHGQKSGAVNIYNMITTDTIDAVIYDRCLRKIGVFEASIGECSEILGDINASIRKIMLDGKLNEEERKTKLVQLADNEVRKVQEMQRLEQAEKSLYGFDLSEYMEEDVTSARNAWINPDNIRNLVSSFLEDRWGAGEYLQGKGAGNNLNLGAEKRRGLLAELRRMDVQLNTRAANLWQAYLASDKSRLAVTFDSDYAKEHEGTAFLTQMHPFVQQAAAHESKKLPCRVEIRLKSREIPQGTYEFWIYAWKYVGLRPDIRLLVVSQEPAVERHLLSQMHHAADYAGSDAKRFHAGAQRELEELHYKRWQVEKEKYCAKVQEECRYRQSHVEHVLQQRLGILRNSLESMEDEKIRRMRKSQIQSTSHKYEEQIEQLKALEKRADIRAERLVLGILHVEERARDGED